MLVARVGFTEHRKGGAPVGDDQHIAPRPQEIRGNLRDALQNRAMESSFRAAPRPAPRPDSSRPGVQAQYVTGLEHILEWRQLPRLARFRGMM
jgi:hypothetical protein